MINREPTSDKEITREIFQTTIRPGSRVRAFQGVNAGRTGTIISRNRSKVVVRWDPVP